jgi:hypothetical protein
VNRNIKGQYFKDLHSSFAISSTFQHMKYNKNNMLSVPCPF